MDRRLAKAFIGLGLIVAVVTATMWRVGKCSGRSCRVCHFALTVTNGLGAVRVPLVVKVMERAREVAPEESRFEIEGDGAGVLCRGELKGGYDVVAAAWEIIGKLNGELKGQNDKREHVVTARSRSALEKARFLYEEAVRCSDVRHGGCAIDIDGLRASYMKAQEQYDLCVSVAAKYRDLLVVVEDPH